MKRVVSEKGQVAIPKPRREKLGLRPGQVLEFETRDGVLVGRKAAAQENPVDAARGVLKRMSVDAEIEKMRGKPWNAADDRPVRSAVDTTVLLHAFSDSRDRGFTRRYFRRLSILDPSR